MKKYIVLSMVLAASLLFGCRTPTTSTGTDANIQRVANVCELAAYTGTRVYLMDHPDDRGLFAASLESLNVLIQDGQYDPVKFRGALSGLPVKELQGEQGKIIVDAAVILFDQLAKEYIDVSKVTWLKPIMVSTRDGLGRALAQ